MDINIKFDCSNVNWNNIADMLKRVGMGHHSPHIHKKAFENSAVTVFVYNGNSLIGFGRAISDGAYQGALYDVAVDPVYQQKGIGSIIVENIMNRLAGCNVILYASPGKESFYKKHNFRQMKTGMACFIDPDKKRETGFTD